jgi:hypothetical protein
MSPPKSRKYSKKLRQYGAKSNHKIPWSPAIGFETGFGLEGSPINPPFDITCDITGAFFRDFCGKKVTWTADPGRVAVAKVPKARVGKKDKKESH